MFWQLEHQMVLGIERMAPGWWVDGGPLLPCFLSSRSQNHQHVFFRNEQRFGSTSDQEYVNTSVPDPWHFGVDPNPDPRIMPLNNGSGSCFFRHWPPRHQQKRFFCLLLFECRFTTFSKDKKSKTSHKTVRIKVFLTIYLMIEGSGSRSTPLTNGSGSGFGRRGPKTCGSGGSRSGFGSGTLVNT